MRHSLPCPSLPCGARAAEMVNRKVVTPKLRAQVTPHAAVAAPTLVRTAPPRGSRFPRGVRAPRARAGFAHPRMEQFLCEPHGARAVCVADHAIAVMSCNTLHGVARLARAQVSARSSAFPLQRAAPPPTLGLTWSLAPFCLCGGHQLGRQARACDASAHVVARAARAFVGLPP